MTAASLPTGCAKRRLRMTTPEAEPPPRAGLCTPIMPRMLTLNQWCLWCNSRLMPHRPVLLGMGFLRHDSGLLRRRLPAPVRQMYRSRADSLSRRQLRT